MIFFNRHKEIKKEIKKEKQSFRKNIKNLKSIDKKMLNFGGEISIFCNDVSIWHWGLSYDDFIKKLTEIKKTKKLTFQSYWIPHGNSICVSYYYNDKKEVKFEIVTKDTDEIIDKISNGKCKIEEITSKTIVCKV